MYCVRYEDCWSTHYKWCIRVQDLGKRTWFIHVFSSEILVFMPVDDAARSLTEEHLAVDILALLFPLVDKFLGQGGVGEEGVRVKVEQDLEPQPVPTI